MQLRQLVLSLSLVLSASTLVAQSLPDAPTATRRADSALQEVQESVNNRVTFEGHAADLERLLGNYEALLNAEQLVQYRAQLKLAREEYQRFAVGEDLVRLGDTVTALEAEWSEVQATLESSDSPNARDGAIDDLRRSIDSARTDLAKLPADRTAAYEQRIDTLAQVFESKVGVGEASERLASLEEYWQRDTAETAGWEQETAVDYATYVSTRSAATSAFGMPKTLEFFEQATHKLEQVREEGNAPAAYVEKLERIRSESRAKLLAAANTLVGAATEKPAGDEKAREALGLLDESLRVTLNAEQDADFGALATRTQDWIKAAAAADTSSEEGRARYYEQMGVSAKAAWPQMEQHYEVARGFDPTNPGALEGQLIRIETDNLMGWRFNTGDFPFATTISGLPVAATYSPEVAAAIAQVEGKLGRALGDSDDDGRWTIIAEVTGRMGKMSLRKQVEGDIRDSSSGEKLGTYRGEEAETVDAPILDIVAAYVGPLAVASGVGAARADGSLAPVDASAAKSGSTASAGSWLGRLPIVLLGIFAAALCWVSAHPTRARELAQAQGKSSMLERVLPVLPLAGIGCAVFGVLWLLSGLVIADLVPALALTAAGLYSAMPLLGRFLQPEHLSRLRPLGLTAAVATVAAMGLHLVLGASALL